MSILFFEGFETSGDSVGFANRTDNIDNFPKRWDDFSKSGLDADWPFLIDDLFVEGYALQMGENAFSNGNIMTWDVPPTLHVPAGPTSPTFVVGFRVHVPLTSRTFIAVQIMGQFLVDANQRQMSLNIDSSSDLTLNLGVFANFHTASSAVVAGQWHYIEFRFKNAESADGGLIQVWVDDNLVIDLDPQDANNAMSVAATSQIKFGTTNATTDAGDFVAYDDIYILHEDVEPQTSRLGIVRVRSLPPVSDVLGGWETNDETSPNYEKVDENGVNVSDYVETNESNVRDRYVLTDTTEEETIFAVKTETEAINTQGGDPSIFLELKSGTTVDSQEQVITDTVNYEVFQRYYDENPDTSAAWVNSEVDDLTAGFSFESNVS